MRNTGPKTTLSSLMSTDASGLSKYNAMELAAHIIDLSSDEKAPQGLDYGESLLDRIVASGISDYHACRAHYFRANIWAEKVSTFRRKRRMGLEK